jgi:branched-chain amino acid transport system substrate-binding protein
MNGKIGYWLAAFLLLSAPLRAEDIHAIVPLSGGAGFVGHTAQQALQLEEKLFNKEGGINGRPVHFIVHDDTSNPQVAVQLATEVLGGGATVMLGSSITAMCNAMSPLVGHGALMYCFSPGIHPAPGSFIFSSSASTNATIETLIRYFHHRGWTRLAFLVSTDSSGQDGDKGIDKALALPEFKDDVVVERAHFNPADVSVAAQIERIRAGHPQALITWASGLQFGTVLNGLTQAGLDIPVASTGANLSYIFMAQYKNILPKRLFFAGGAATPRGDIPKLDPRVAAAKKRYYALFAAAGLVPDNGVETVWDSTAIVVDALRHLGPNPGAEAIRNCIAHLQGYIGVSGVYDFVKEPQRGLGPDDGVISRWNTQTQMFEAMSNPGGEPIVH